jgi:hypothetical protein
MKQNMRNNSSGTNRPLGRLAGQKKKTICALCLIAVMVFMWVRVLGRKGPASAEATLTTPEATSGPSNPKLKISFIELPKVAGRNDMLTRDFFTGQGFIKDIEGGNLGGVAEVSVGPGDGSEQAVKRVAQKLKLEAIGVGEQPQAFINGELLTVGDRLTLQDGGNKYECEVIGIEENEVFVRWQQAEIKLKLAPMLEVAD